jgi:hypothetical protein
VKAKPASPNGPGFAPRKRASRMDVTPAFAVGALSAVATPSPLNEIVRIKSDPSWWLWVAFCSDMVKVELLRSLIDRNNSNGLLCCAIYSSGNKGGQVSMSIVAQVFPLIMRGTVDGPSLSLHMHAVTLF